MQDIFYIIFPPQQFKLWTTKSCKYLIIVANICEKWERKCRILDDCHLVVTSNLICCVTYSGYLAPEYALHGQLTKKADIYSFGVLVLEIVSGKSSSKSLWSESGKLLLELVSPHLKTMYLTLY